MHNTAYKQWRAFGGARFVLRIIARVPGQVIALNSATAHTRKRYPNNKARSKPLLRAIMNTKQETRQDEFNLLFVYRHFIASCSIGAGIVHHHEQVAFGAHFGSIGFYLFAGL